MKNMAKIIVLGILSFNVVFAYQFACDETSVLNDLRTEFKTRVMEEGIKVAYKQEQKVKPNPNMDFETFKEFMLDIFNSPEKRRMFGISDEDYKESFGIFDTLEFINIKQAGDMCSAEAVAPGAKRGGAIKYKLNPVNIANFEEIANAIKNSN